MSKKCKKVQGQSAATIEKQKGFKSAFAMSLLIANNYSRKTGTCRRFWYGDMNCGSGFNHEAGIEGSPVLFHRTADEILTDMDRCVLACDTSENAINELKGRLVQNQIWDQSTTLALGRNGKALEHFAQMIGGSRWKPSHAFGIVLFDPNGWFHVAQTDPQCPSIEELKDFVIKCPKIDIVFNLNVRTLQQMRGARDHLGHKYGHIVGGRELLKSVGKAFWLVKWNPDRTGRWFLAVGRNMETNDHKRRGFFKLDSPDGQRILDQVDGITPLDPQESFDLFSQPCYEEKRA